MMRLMHGAPLLCHRRYKGEKVNLGTAVYGNLLAPIMTSERIMLGKGLKVPRKRLSNFMLDSGYDEVKGNMLFLKEAKVLTELFKK